MEEEGGEDDAQQMERENNGEEVIFRMYFWRKKRKDLKSLFIPSYNRAPDSNRPYPKNACIDGHVDPSKLFTKYNFRVGVTESKVGKRGEDDQGRMSVEDLQRGGIFQVQCGEEGEEEWREK